MVRVAWKGPAAAAAILAAYAAAGEARAQTFPQIPRPPTAEEVQRSAQTPNPTAQPPKVITGQPLAAQQCPQALLDSPITTELKAVEFTGPDGAALPDRLITLLAPVASLSTGRTQPIRIVCDVRDAATQLLTQAGYVAVVRVPEQTMADGRLRLEVIAAHIASLRVRGDPGAMRTTVAGMLNKLTALTPFNQYEAERILLIAGDIPGLSITLELSPSPDGAVGEVVGDVSIEHIGGTVLVNAQNYGSEQIGRFGGLVRAEVYGLTGLADRTTLSLYSTSDFTEQEVVELAHDFALNGDGLRFAGHFTYAWTHPTLPSFGNNVDLRAETLISTMRLTYPLVRGLGDNVLLSGGFQWIDQWVRNKTTPINRDAQRVLFARVDASTEERSGGHPPRWQFGGAVELRHGLDILGANKPSQINDGAFPTRFEGDPQAFVARGELSALARLLFGLDKAWALTAAVQSRGQWSNHPLLAYEEFAVGNLTLGRGYDPGVTSGDRALGGAFELRFGKPIAASRNDLSYEAFGFYDAVRIWNLDTGTLENDRLLASVGGGVRLAWGDHGRLDLTYAHPLDRGLAQDLGSPSDRLLLSLVLRAWPWLK